MEFVKTIESYLELSWLSPVAALSIRAFTEALKKVNKKLRL
jgi:hypothetical protein